MIKEEQIKLQEYYLDQMVIYLPMIRQALRITQKELAGKLGLSRQTIVTYETRSQRLPWNVYLALILLFQQYDVSRNLLEKLELFDASFVAEVG